VLEHLTRRKFLRLKRITQNSGKGMLYPLSCNVAWIEPVMNGNIQILYPEGGGTVLLWNDGGCLPVGMASDFSILES
jgi:hypothetical protein